MSEPTLKNWMGIDGRLIGEVYGDERFPDGKVITTTDVIEFEKSENAIYVLTKGMRYKLEKSDE